MAKANKLLAGIKSALQGAVRTYEAARPLLTARNASVALGVLSLFGVIAPETATKIRNSVLVPLALASPDTVDLIGGGQ